MRDNEKVCADTGVSHPSGIPPAAEGPLLAPQPQARLALAGARSQGGMSLAPETPDPSSRLALIFSPLSTFSACSSVSRQAVNQSPGLCGRALQRGERCFTGVGRNYPGSEGNHPAVGSLLALAARSCTFLRRHSCRAEDFPLCGASLPGAVPGDGCSPRRRCREGTHRSLLLLRSEMNGAAALKPTQTSFILHVQGCKTRAGAGSLALRFLTWQMERVRHTLQRSHMERQRIYKIST